MIPLCINQNYADTGVYGIYNNAIMQPKQAHSPLRGILST